MDPDGRMEGGRYRGLAARWPSVQGHRHEQLLSGSAWLTVSVGVNAVSGLVFWLIAYRLESAEVVGSALGLFTAVMFATYATNMGLPVALARFAPGDEPRSHRLFALALGYTALTSLVAALVFHGLASAELLDVVDIGVTGGDIVVFFLLVTGMSFAVLVEVRLMTLRWWRWLPTRVAIIGIVRLPLLFIEPIAENLWLVLLVAGLPALTGYVWAALLELRTPRGEDRTPVPGLGTIFRFASVNYVGVLALQAPQFVVPLIVLTSVSTSAFAAFYVVWSATAIIFLVPHVVGQALLAEGGREPEAAEAQFRLALLITSAFMLAATVAAVAYPEILTVVFGSDADDAVPLLGRFVGAGLFWAVTCTTLNRARIRSDTVGTLAITGASAVATIGCVAWFTQANGTDGTADGWFLGNALACIVAVLVLLRDRPLRPTRDVVAEPTTASAPQELLDLYRQQR